jgi:hypothetical protein
MKLSDVMSAANLATYAEAGLVLFLIAFVAITIQIVLRGRALEHLSRLPLESTAADSKRPEESPR